MDIINYFSYSSINVEGFYMILANSFAVALFEQCVVGGALLGHMMHHWKGKPGGIMKSAVLSSLIFGFMHVGRVFEINTVGTVDLLLKFSYGLGIGMLFAAAYLRTGNLWPVILFHTILDFFSMLSRIYMQPVADVDAYYAKYPSPAFSSNIITMEKMSGVISVLLIVLAVFELRKKEHGAINAVWDGMCEPAAEKPLSAAGSARQNKWKRGKRWLYPDLLRGAYHTEYGRLPYLLGSCISGRS
jgi:membrane protease YdiL (CAAX protease family)